MRPLHPFGLVDRPLNLVVGPFKAGLLLRPHGEDDLHRLAQSLQTFGRLRIRVTISTVFVLVPARPNTQVEATMTERIDGARHLGEKRGIAIAITRHYLTYTHAFRIACQGSN